MNDLLQGFLSYCRRSQGLSETTLRGYDDSARGFLRWFEQDAGRTPTLADWTADTAEAFLASMKIRGLRQTTRRQRIASLRSFGNWLVKTKRVADNPWLALRTPVNEELRQPCPSAAVVNKLLDACDHMPNRTRGALAKAAVALCALAGLRLFEMRALHMADVHIDGDKRFVLVRNGKGQKAGAVPLSARACEILRAWLEVRPATELPHLLYLRHTDRPTTATPRPDRALSDNAFYDLLSALKRIAWLDDEDLTAHALRRFGGTMIAQQKNASIADAQKFLRQSNLQTTLRYLKPNSPLVEFVEGILPGDAEPSKPKPGKKKDKQTAARVAEVIEIMRRLQK